MHNLLTRVYVTFEISFFFIIYGNLNENQMESDRVINIIYYYRHRMGIFKFLNEEVRCLIRIYLKQNMQVHDILLLILLL